MNQYKINNSKISLCLISFKIECATYDHKGQCVQDVRLRYQAAVSPSPLPYSQPFHCPLVYGN